MFSEEFSLDVWWIRRGISKTARVYLALLVLLFFMMPNFVAQAYASPVKTANLDALLERESIGHVVFDPNEDRVFFELLGSLDDAEIPLPYLSAFSVLAARKKIYVSSLDGKAEAHLLFEQDPSNGYYFAGHNPWSSDGKHVALLRLKNGHLQPGWINTATLQASFVEMHVAFFEAGTSVHWVDDETLVVLSTAGDSRSPAIGVDAIRRYSDVRESAWERRLVTASAVGAGKYASDPGTFPETQFKLINIGSGNVRVVAQGSFDGMYLSPDRKHLVTFERRPGELIIKNSDENESIRFGSKVALVTIDLTTGEKKTIEPKQGERLTFEGWSDSGHWFILAKTTALSVGSQKHYFILSADAQGVATDLPEGAENPFWVNDEVVFISTSKTSKRSDWYALDANGDLENLTSSFDQLPKWVARSETGLFGVHDDNLWYFDWESGLRSDLLRSLTHELLPASIPTRFEAMSGARQQSLPFIEQAMFGTDRELHGSLFSFSDATARDELSMVVPEKESVLLAVGDWGAIFLTNSTEFGSRLQLSLKGVREEPDTILQFNEQLAGVETAVGPISIEHNGYDGSSVQGWLYLPAGSNADGSEKYPLVVIPYAGHVYEFGKAAAKPPFRESVWDLQLTRNTVMEVFAARGYAVLLPSIPLERPGEQGDPLLRIAPAVLSALDASIDTGLIDTERVAISGQSYGGYAALATASQTDRFDAVVAMAALTNLTSLYGQFIPTFQLDAGQQYPIGWAQTAYLESDQGRMGSPPWVDADRYIRNSPLFYADQFTSPIMLIHGDLDFVLMTQAEEMFTALARENKDALFVRYWGEQHYLLQPQNQRDMWNRVFGFLEQNGVTPGPKTVH